MQHRNLISFYGAPIKCYGHVNMHRRDPYDGAADAGHDRQWTEVPWGVPRLLPRHEVILQNYRVVYGNYYV